MIELKEISFTYAQAGHLKGLQNINLSIKAGEVVLLCGESGCGKTTLTRLINGLIPHFWEGDLRGEVLVDGKMIQEIPLYESAKTIGSVFQNPRSQFFTVDTTGELAFGSENQGLPATLIKERIQNTVEQFEIEALLGRSIFALSGGEKQKIACASVSACQPEILVLDEPSANLDAKTTNDLRQMLRKWKEEGKTIVIAEHRLHFLWDIVDRIVYMSQGRINQVFSQKEFARLDSKTLRNMGLRPFSFASLALSVGQPQPSKHSLVFSDFQCTYKRGIPVLDIDDLQVPLGSCVAVIGNNGAAKTTFARCLCGLEKKCKGQVWEGSKALKRKNRLRRCYMVMQDVNHQLFTESVLEEMLVSMETPSTEQAEEVLGGLNLSDLKEVHPMALSGGEKQRVAIASALVSQCEIILFDEPTSGLDLRHMREVSRNIEQLTEMGKTIFVITHDPELILSCCTHVVHMQKGSVIDNYSLNESSKQKMLSFFQQQQT